VLEWEESVTTQVLRSVVGLIVPLVLPALPKHLEQNHKKFK
jgi:hypothetical protein